MFMLHTNCWLYTSIKVSNLLPFLYKQGWRHTIICASFKVPNLFSCKDIRTYLQLHKRRNVNKTEDLVYNGGTKASKIVVFSNQSHSRYYRV